ncbi:NitT/TauT family transport system permease protein [Klenkia soli]|uniref:NitT/TauT family transport system permease protein n=1 Tax=Klenkia soli TaxID=1052260 RepID=A0A1H0KH83_9ACTN|nr:ABC transporter permease [Klenkia soli]SDO55121.1 NitT/TauT family transport system permease protein [Klenkia soli]
MTATLPTAEETRVTTTLESPTQAPVAAGATPAPLVRRRRRNKLTSYLLPVVVFAALIGVWYAITYLFLEPGKRFLMPAPHTLITDALLDPVITDKVWPALGRTIVVSFAGLGIAIVIGMLWAIAMSQSKAVEASLYPYAVALQCIPILALVPLIGFWFDFGFESRVIVCVMIALFPIVSNTLFGIQSVDRGHHELFTLHRAGRITRLVKLQLPAALPAIFAGFRISAGLSVVGAIVGDLFFKKGDPGLGILLSNFSSRLQGAPLFFTIVVTAVLGFAVFFLFGLLAKLAVGRWYDQSRDAG